MTATVAAFDFDGTISRRDSLLPFLRRACGAQRLYRTLLANGFDLAGMLTGRVERDAVKERVLRTLLAGMPLAHVAAAAERFAEELLDDRRLRGATVERIEEHRAAGHELVLVSASPALYLDHVGESLGFDAVLATRMEVADDGTLTGRLVGANCRGPEKVARLETWLDGRDVRLWAYGDSSGDAELLARADVPCHVRNGPLAPLDA